MRAAQVHGIRRNPDTGVFEVLLGLLRDDVTQELWFLPGDKAAPDGDKGDKKEGDDKKPTDKKPPEEKK